MNRMLRPVLFIFVFLGTLFLNINSFSQCTTLVWSDEFDGTTLDQTKWAYALGRGCDQPSGCGFGNGEEQAYTNLPKNITVGGGNLTITAIFDNPQAGAAFSSAKIQTVGLKTFQYGKIEARMKLPSGQGAWPAFWMLAQNNNWPFTGEIDIMEAKHRNPTQVMGTVHHYNGHTTGQLTTPDLSAAFHTYAIEWERDEIRWYFDDELYHRSSPQTTGGAWPFNDTGNPFYLIFNLAVGGLGTPFTGNQAFNSADFPQSFQVDYVRVYSGTWNVEFTGDPFVYKGEENKTYAVSAVSGATYNWTLPAGVTLVSGQGTNQISVTYESTAVSGDIEVSVTSGCETQVYMKAISVEEQFQVSNILKDWDANNNMTLSSSSGTLTQEVNPAGSTNVGKYVRNGGQLYDNIIYKNVAFGNASDFLTRRRRIHMDLYTTAPVGTKVRIQLENTARSAQTFPVGRHSVYEALTTKQNGWETLEFEYVNSPDLATGSTTVDQLAILFAVETNTAHTYYMDNIVIGTAGEPCPRTLNQTLEDFQTNRNITFSSSTGTLTSVVNPETGGINTSAQVGKYIRNSGELYDVLFYKDVALNNVENFRNGKAVFKMQVYTTAPVGTTISLQLETSASTPSNYPTGRHSLYQAVTAVQNQWQTLEFSFIGRLDALALDEQVNTIVFLFAPGTNTGATYHFDNLLTESETCVVVPVTGISVTPTTFSLAGGATRQLSPAVAPSNASNKSVTYSSSNTAVATVSTNGVVTGLTIGTSTITVTSVDGSFTATAEVTVTSSIVPVTGVTVSPETVSFNVGATQQLTATVAPANATIKTVSWSSSNASVASVDGSGLVTGVAPGNATIAVTTQNGAQTATASITVLSIPVTGVTIAPTSSSIVINTTKQLTATLAPANATNKNVSWSSNNPAVATVNASGLVSGVAAGSATITATTQDGSHTATSSVEVTLPLTSCSGNGPTASGQSVADYAYEITSTGNTATIKFIVNSPIAGCDFVIFYWRAGSSGGFAGQGMTQSGNTFTTTVNVTSGSTISTYFTYRRSAGGMESNSSANPHLFVAGQCTGESNTLPTVTLTSPETGSAFAVGSNISISANASDASPGSIAKVEFFHGTTKIGEDTSSPYSIVWNDVPEGTYSITAKATDNQLGATVSGAISITVSVVTGVEPDSETKITLYPNPTTDIITITLGVKLEGGALKIVDGIGQEKMLRSNVMSGSLNVSTLSPGIYLLTIVQGSHKVVKRFVKR